MTDLTVDEAPAAGARVRRAVPRPAAADTLRLVGELLLRMGLARPSGR